ncbi:hypothetical protein FGIG_10434 [Fasciola gigantica]|uniref:G-protein coupled receptors family 1 profile domain-containing protein n=1 Tax=Fasciola gigantica TaxID=46835 RepID=A0A504Y811_FASGI|nr:hypothetical protein FGIG_10434 [Fasciola gigantica]
MNSELQAGGRGGNEFRANLTAGVQFFLLIFILFLSLIENFFLFLISFTSVSRWCRAQCMNRRYRNSITTHTGYSARTPVRKDVTSERASSLRQRYGITHLLVLIPGSDPMRSMTMLTDSDMDIYQCFILGQHDEEKHWQMAITYFLLAFLLPFVFVIVAYAKIYLAVRRCLRQLPSGTPLCQETDVYQTLRRSYSSGPIRRDSDDENLNNNNNNMTITSVCTVPVARAYLMARLAKRESHRSYDFGASYRRRGQKLQTKAAKTACILVTTFFSLTAPYFIYSAVESFINIPFTVIPEETQDELSETISSIIVWLLYVNSVLTPGLYALRDGVLRRRIASIWPVPYKVRTNMRLRSFVD